MKRTRRTYGTGSLQQAGETKWVLFYKPKGAPRRLTKPVEAPTRKDAEKLLASWVKELDRQVNPGVHLPMSQLFDMYVADLRREGRSEVCRNRDRIDKHLVPVFGQMEASSLKKMDVTNYVDMRLDAGAAPGTINIELSALKRSLNIGFNEGLLIDPPPRFKKLRVNNTRRGFMEPSQYSVMLRALPGEYQMLFAFGHFLGVRLGELLSLLWEWLLPYWHDEDKIVKIPGECCKSGEPHTIPLYHPDLIAFVEMAFGKRDERCPFLFQHEGKCLKFDYRIWDEARTAAGLPSLLFHDLRRTAVRNMERAGIPRSEAMQITGHKTESVYKRYDISSERGAKETGRRMHDFFRQQAERAAAAEAATSKSALPQNPEKFATEFAIKKPQ